MLAALRRRDPLPGREEPCIGALLDRLDFLAQECERPTTQLTQHLGIAPLAFDAAGTELAIDDATSCGESLEHGVRPLKGDLIALEQLSHDERSVRAGIAADEIVEWMVDRIGECTR